MAIINELKAKGNDGINLRKYSAMQNIKAPFLIYFVSS